MLSIICDVVRDISGRITAKTEETSGTVQVWGYAYDTLGRLATVTLDGQLAESYAYDENGNRTQTRVPARGIDTTLTSSFDTEDRASTVGDTTYTYTPDGYLALKHSQEGTTTYAYSAFGELEEVTLPDGRSISYTYDASGRRTSKAIDGTVIERYLWADATRLLATYDADGTQLMRFLYADARTPYAADTDAGRIFFAYDQAGSLRTVTAEDGSVLKTLTHDSFGNVIYDSDPALEIPLGFAGGMHDPDTGLTLFGARDYDPTLGRWLAKDPIGFAGGDANLYGYCLGDPVNLVDPSGLYLAAGGGAGPVDPDASPPGTVSVGRQLSGGPWAEGHLGVELNADLSGTVSLTVTSGGGATLVPNRAEAWSIQFTGAPCVESLEGSSWSRGASSPIVGYDRIWGANEYWRHEGTGWPYPSYDGIQINFGPSTAPGEVHGRVSNTWTIGKVELW